MSRAQNSPIPTGAKRIKHYAPGTGSDRYIRFCEDWLNLRLGRFQKRLLEALEQHRRVIAVAANGVGKSYGGGAAGSLAALYCNPDTTVNITSGSYGQLDDSIWKPLKSLHRRSSLPGRTLDNTREVRTEFDEEWYLKCLSPRRPGDLEGRHNDRMVYIIEEADKDGIQADHIDSAESTLTDSEDRLLIICNPPEDETNAVYDLAKPSNDKWHTLRFSSLESHNVLIDAGKETGEKIDGLVELDEVRESWEDWNAEPWPGFEEARIAHESRTDLDSRWYRRRGGVMPPVGASAHRPFMSNSVEAAFDRSPTNVTQTPQGLGYDVARMGGDSNSVVGVYGDELRVFETWRGTDHTQNEAKVRGFLGDGWDATFAVDATPEGSGLADRINTFYPDLYRYQNGSDAIDKAAYKNKWTEALAHLGDFLQNGGSFSDRRLREELLAAANTVEYESKFYATRDAEVLVATSKDKVKDILGRSPDVLDAAMMAVWASEVDLQTRERPDHHGVRSL